MDDQVKAIFEIIGIIITSIFVLPFWIFMACCWGHVGGVAYDVILLDKEPTIANMFQIIYVTIISIALSSFYKPDCKHK